MQFRYSERKMVDLFANCGDPDHTPRYAASDLGQHCFPITILRVFRLQWDYYRFPSAKVFTVASVDQHRKHKKNPSQRYVSEQN